jgi:hyperosmotically inducible periplasmic protein
MTPRSNPVLLAGAIAGLLALAACDNRQQVASDPLATPSTNTADASSDEVLAAAVQTALLADPTTRGRPIRVQAVEGQVILRGLVSDAPQADAAQAVARRVAGVKNVDNRLVVQVAGTGGPASLDDVLVTERVKTALRNEGSFKGADIQVMTIKGDVRLSGVVSSQQQLEEALKLARGVDGVRSIQDELHVNK